MRILVTLRDGRTVWELPSRGALAMLVGREPWDEHGAGVVCQRGIWNPLEHVYVWTPGIRLRFLAKGSIASVEQLAGERSEQPNPGTSLPLPIAADPELSAAT